MAVAVAPRLLHELLPELRRKRGLSQADLSAATVRLGDHGIAVNTIQSYEKAKNAGRVPEVEILEALAAGLGENPDVFYEWPIAVARRDARPAASRRDAKPRPDVTRRAREAAQRLDGTAPTSRRKRRARDGGDPEA